MAQSQNPVPKVYKTVVEDVINNVRESFLDECVDEQVLQELKQLWESKLQQSKAVDGIPAEQQENPLLQQHFAAIQQSRPAAATVIQPTPPQPTAIQTSQGQLPIILHQSGVELMDDLNQDFYKDPYRDFYRDSYRDDYRESYRQQQQQQPPYREQYNNYDYNNTWPLGQGAAPATGCGGGNDYMAAGDMFSGLVPNQSPPAAAHGHGPAGLGLGPGPGAYPPNLHQETGAAAQATFALPQGVYQQQLAALNAGGGITLQQTPSGQFIIQQQQPQVITTQQPGTMVTTTALQQNVLTTADLQQATQPQPLIQLDGANDTSSEDDDFDNDDDDDDNEQNEEDNEFQGEEEEPLNSEDDVSDEDPSDLFETDNVVVCQYDKISRSKNKWKFHLKDGIMNLNGKDYVFMKATGDAEW